MAGFRPGWLDELGLAVRLLARRPKHSLAAAAITAMGMAAYTAVFTVADTVLLESPPYPAPDRLVMSWNTFRSSGLERLPLSFAQIEALAGSPTFEAAGGVWVSSTVLGTADGYRNVTSAHITPGLQEMLGISPSLGRGLAADEFGRGTVTAFLISDRLWRTELGAEDVIGKVVRLDNDNATIVGVLPADFTFVLPVDSNVPPEVDVIVPLSSPPGEMPVAQFFLRTLARLAPGASLAEAQQAADAVASGMRREHGELADLDVVLELVPLHRDAARRLRATLLALGVGATLFLALAVANVATLLIGRVQHRSRELAVSLALGAPVARLALRLGVELLAVTVAGSAVGITAGFWLARVLWRARPDGLSGLAEVTGSTRVVVILALTVLSLAIPCAWTLWRYVRRWRGASVMQRGPVSSGVVRQLMLGAQVALGVIFVAGAWLLGRSVSEQRTEGIGVATEDIVTFQVAISEKVYPVAADRWNVARELRERVAALGGVRAVGGVTHLPLGRWPNWSENVATEGMAVAEEVHADHRAVTPGYFEALGVRLLEGRSFTDADTASRPLVAILDRALAERLFQGSAVGRRVRVGRYGDQGFTHEWATVVGVMDEIRDRGPTVPSTGQVYVPFAQSARWEISFVVQTDAGADRLLEPISREMASLGALAPARMETLDRSFARAVAPTRFTAWLANLSSSISIGLAAIGLFGWVSASCAERRNELGLRISLGASPIRVFAASLLPLMRMLTPGLLAGALLAWLLVRRLHPLLFRVGGESAVACMGAALVLALVALAAAAGPAWRASVTQPAEILRQPLKAGF